MRPTAQPLCAMGLSPRLAPCRAVTPGSLESRHTLLHTHTALLHKLHSCFHRSRLGAAYQGCCGLGEQCLCLCLPCSSGRRRCAPRFGQLGPVTPWLPVCEALWPVQGQGRRSSACPVVVWWERWCQQHCLGCWVWDRQLGV